MGERGVGSQPVGVVPGGDQQLPGVVGGDSEQGGGARRRGGDQAAELGVQRADLGVQGEDAAGDVS